MIDEEVVELVRAYKVFGFLGYVSFFVGRDKLGTDGCVSDVEEDPSCFVVDFVGKVDYNLADKCFGNSRVDAIQ